MGFRPTPYVVPLVIGSALLSWVAATIADRKALRENQKAFVSRLREIGFYRDLSDAYVTQTVTPRYRIAKTEKMPAREEGAVK